MLPLHRLFWGQALPATLSGTVEALLTVRTVKTTLNKGLECFGNVRTLCHLSLMRCICAAVSPLYKVRTPRRAHSFGGQLRGAETAKTPHTLTNTRGIMMGFSWKLFVLFCLVVENSGQDLGQTQFICTSVPKDIDLCTATMQNSGPVEDLKTTVMLLRETVLQQKETIMSQKETIRELTSKLSRCEGQSLPAAGPGGRRPGSKNTMGDVSRGTTDTLAQLGQTLQTLKQRLENLEVCM